MNTSRRTVCVFMLQLLIKLGTGESCSREGEVRLTDGASANVGRVEICLGGVWDTVCHYQWGISDARVVCRQLGLPEQHSDALYGYDGGSRPIHYAGFSCTGEETTLTACDVAYNSSVPCYHFEGAGVVCTNESCSENAVRINDGVVQVCHDHQWSMICSDAQTWDTNTAKVLCMQVGQPSVFPFSQTSFVSNFDTPITLWDVSCTGSESSISDCRSASYSVHDTCSRVAVVHCEEQVSCSEGRVRLTHLRDNRSGRLEVCAGRLWGTVCGDGATANLAKVVWSIEMGVDPNTLLSYNLLPIKRTNVRCKGNERSFSECSSNETDEELTCNHNHDVFIHCDGRQCVENEVRLMDGITSMDGRVEICLDGVWGAICHDRWDSRDAQVVCRQLKFDGPSFPLAATVVRNLPYHLDDVHCRGNESTLSECSHNGLGITDCPQGYRDAHVLCTNVTCEDKSVYLVGGDAPNRGRVMYCHQGTWYSICADDWDERGEEVRAVCHGLDHSNFASVLDNYGRGTLPILPFSVSCTAEDNNLGSCEKSVILDVSLCSQVAGINCAALCLTVGVEHCTECAKDNCTVIDRSDGTLICDCYNGCYLHGNCCSDLSHVKCNDPECMTGDVRLVGGVTNSTGRLEVCANGVWGRVCNRYRYWGPDNARVICRQLSYSDEGAYVVEDDLSDVFGKSERNPLVAEVHCTGSELEWFECSHNSIGRHKCGVDDSEVPDIVISCLDKGNSCEEGDVRLVNGFGPSNGHVEYCHHRTWGKVCAEDFDDTDASVVCRQMGYNPADATVIEELIGENLNTPVFLSSVSCSGSESRLSQCSTQRASSFTCASAAVKCTVITDVGECNDSLSVIPTNQSLKVGQCQVYTDSAGVCSGVLTEGIDYIYIPNRLGTQKSVVERLNIALGISRGLLDAQDNYCTELMLRIICEYYLPHCGNATHSKWPSSVCRDECNYVKKSCSATWQAVALIFGTLSSLSCDNPSQLLDPIPHCCTGVGIKVPPASPMVTSTINPVVVSFGLEDEDEAVVGIVTGAVATALLVTIIIGLIVLLPFLYQRHHQRSRIRLATLDIMATDKGSSGLGSPIGLGDIIPFSSRNQLFISEAVGNSYYDDKVSEGALSRPRVLSHHVREFSRSNFIIKRNNITIIDNIGEGEFGIVYKANVKTRRGPIEQVAIKTLKGTFDQLEINKFVEESLKMSRFKHCHVMGLIGVCLDAGTAPLVIMPFMAHGSLLKYLKKERDSLVVSEENTIEEIEEARKRLLAMCSQIASGMEYLADEKYIHRDLAARNCMIDLNFVIKIADFGLSEDVFERNYFRQESHEEVVKLPVKWMAPESLSDGHFSEKSDVWSYGVTMWEIFSGGKAPYPGTEPLSLMGELEDGYRMPPPSNEACSNEIYGMMENCWEKSPVQRPSFKDIHSNISQYIGCIGGYLDMGVNPFTSVEENKPQKDLSSDYISMMKQEEDKNT